MKGKWKMSKRVYVLLLIVVSLIVLFVKNVYKSTENYDLEVQNKNLEKNANYYDETNNGYGIPETDSNDTSIDNMEIYEFIYL